MPSKRGGEVGDGAPIHHAQPGVHDAFHVHRPRPAEHQPRHALEDLRHHQLDGDDHAERGDYDEPEDTARQPDPGGSVLMLVDRAAEPGHPLVLGPESGGAESRRAPRDWRRSRVEGERRAGAWPVPLPASESWQAGPLVTIPKCSWQTPDVDRVAVGDWDGARIRGRR